MRPINHQLLQFLSMRHQVAEREPSASVFIINPNSGERMRVDRVFSVDLDRDAEARAMSFRFSADNTSGWLSPDYDPKKLDDAVINKIFNRGNPWGNPWASMNGKKIFWPNTKVEIHLGYGDEQLPQLVGYIDDIQINAESATISVQGRSLYKRIIEGTAPEEITYKDHYAEEIIVDLHKRAGVPITADQILLPTGERYKIKEFKIERAEAWESAVSKLLEGTYSYIKTGYDGSSILKQIPQYDQVVDKAVHILDEAHNLTKLGYKITDYDIYNRLTFKIEEEVETEEVDKQENEDKTTKITRYESFDNQTFRDVFCGGQVREDIINIPWADTFAKRELAAKALFRKFRQRYRTMSVSAVGHPALEIYDLCGVRDHISTASQRYYIKAIRTTFSEQGYFDLIELEFP
ncbi:M48 family metallopeptidase [Bacillus chungangensis]|uniref:Uncharacterized protein n=1 Tax=Bacillus chungangensis TaxID=587633 RepID=A0ABT9WU74_9BACI|nr:hypothetical protein [Bacillus chungangensis]MDQ0176731.1 hypothetical protein [Bacillus chungangensis]